MALKKHPPAQAAEYPLVLFTSRDGAVTVPTRLERETLWLTQEQMAQVFEVKRPAVTKHLANIFKTGELDEQSTCSILEHMGQNGARAYATRYYNLDAIIAVGYRVNSRRATQTPAPPAPAYIDHLPTGDHATRITTDR
ncbi:MAG: RhuM family protein [Kiritimatiellae bacterium]|nr:RhuM family protein [Kiritimatiellia bacterium]